MRKTLLIIATIVLSVVAVAGILFWYLTGAPLYTPGMVRAGKNLRGSLSPPRQIGDDSHWLVEDDIRLFRTSQGTGRPILVVHGGPGYPFHDWPAGLALLAKDHKVICYDQRGCGRSTRPFDRFPASNYYTSMTNLERTLGLGAQVADIERIRRILGEEKLILLGHSFGAFLAALYAAEFPEHVEALVLVAPAALLLLPDESGNLFGLIRERLPDNQKAEYDSFLERYLNFGSIFSMSEAELAAMNRRVGEYYLAAAGLTSDAGDTNIPDDNGGWMVQAMYFSMGTRHDYRPALERVSARSLIIHGETDMIPEAVSRMYRDCLPNSRLYVMRSGAAHAGHFLLSDQPEAFAAVVNEFLREK
jgi:proline iminopeptidase